METAASEIKGSLIHPKSESPVIRSVRGAFIKYTE